MDMVVLYIRQSKRSGESRKENDIMNDNISTQCLLGHLSLLQLSFLVAPLLAGVKTNPLLRYLDIEYLPHPNPQSQPFTQLASRCMLLVNVT